MSDKLYCTYCGALNDAESAFCGRCGHALEPLDTPAKEKVEVLILGAFGCGAFCNPPEIVSDIFASLIRNYNFETVEFAVYCRSDTKNFDVFESKFSKFL